MITENDKTVVIMGKAASGKSTLATKLKSENPRHTLYRTDDYAKHGFKESLYVLMEDLAKDSGPKIIEGIQVGRLLRKGVELGTFRPDLIILTEAPYETREARYKSERDEKKIKSLKSFDLALDTVFNEYLTNEKSLPRIEKVQT